MYAKFIQTDGRWAFAFEQPDETWVEYPDDKHAALFAQIKAAYPAPKEIGIGADGLPEVQDPPGPTLGQAKASQLVAIAEAFTAASTAPVTDSAGLTWSGGFDSAQKIYGAAQLAQAGGATSLTIYDASNIGHSLTIAQATAVAAEVGVAYQTVFAKYQGLKVAVAAATTIAAVQAITWS